MQDTPLSERIANDALQLIAQAPSARYRILISGQWWPLLLVQQYVGGRGFVESWIIPSAGAETPSTALEHPRFEFLLQRGRIQKMHHSILIGGTYGNQN